MTNLPKKKYVKVRHDWPAGFQLLVILTPKFDLNDWTLVFHFKEAIDVRLEYFAWEAKLTVSNGGRVATLTNLPWNSGIKKGEKFRFILVVTGFLCCFLCHFNKTLRRQKIYFVIGAARTSLPPYLVQYMDGSKDDMSCLYESHYDTTTTATIGLTSTTTAPLVTTTKTPQEEDPDFCSDKNDGLYAHPDCSKASFFHKML